MSKTWLKPFLKTLYRLKKITRHKIQLFSELDLKCQLSLKNPSNFC